MGSLNRQGRHIDRSLNRQAERQIDRCGQYQPLGHQASRHTHQCEYDLQIFGPTPRIRRRSRLCEMDCTTKWVHWLRRKRALSDSFSAANSRMHHDETRVHAPKATHTKTDHMYKKKTLLVEDSYPAVHTTVRSSPWQKTHKTTVHG